MRHQAEARVNRRLAVGAMAAGAAGLAWPSQQRGRAITQRGVAGGGIIQLENGEAEFSVFASRVTFADDEEVIVGSIEWVDTSAGFAFVSTAVELYEDLESPEEGGELRRVAGVMRLNDEADYPFVFNVLDAGAPGAGRDSAALIVGEDAVIDGNASPVETDGFNYAAAGSIVGDVQVVSFDMGTP